ncbi:hypothetical protein BGZ96_009121 [Linnemannia gamsii]|uniref:Uncharacterized protein n=1 Tax=Linnemannia gamsii TaxID=64522 RepID=A0ABQ7JWV8_9FUNG|nr:hypothetical protein BGZ96_009121 [Linnemannia gamsii]
MRIHIKFHDDVVATKEDVRSTTQLLNKLLLTLEPVLVDHGRDLSNAVYKLSRNDKRSGHTPAEWNVALRHPFDHLTIYNEWLQRIDPHGQFNGPCLAQLNSLVLNVKSAIETHQNPRGMLKRLSTFARGVMKRPSSPLLSLSYSQDSAAASPTTPTTAISVSARDITHVGGNKTGSTHKGSFTRGASMDLARANADATAGTPATATIVAPSMAAAIVTSSPSETRIETVADPSSLNHVRSATTVISPGTVLAESPVGSPKSAATNANRYNGAAALPPRQLNRSSVARSDMSSVGSLTLAPSSESLHMKAAIIASTARPGGPLERQASSSNQRQKFLEEREARKATLRMGAQAFIVAKTESLQQRSPTFVSRPSIDRLRTITKRDVETKPPVKSLINFWEQATEPIEV